MVVHLKRMNRILNRKTISGKKLGRPPSLDDAKIKELLTLLSIGIKISVAADYVGIPHSTLYDWRKRGEEERTRCSDEHCEPVTELKPYVDFSDKLRRSLAFFEVKHALKLDEAAKNDPNLRLTLLRTCSDNWNTTQKIDQTVSAGQGANVTVVLRPASRSRKNGKE